MRNASRLGFLFASVGPSPQIEADPTRAYIAYLGNARHEDGSPPDTIAHLCPTDEMLAEYQRVMPNQP